MPHTKVYIYLCQTNFFGALLWYTFYMLGIERAQNKAIIDQDIPIPIEIENVFNAFVANQKNKQFKIESEDNLIQVWKGQQIIARAFPQAKNSIPINVSGDYFDDLVKIFKNSGLEIKANDNDATRFAVMLQKN